MRRLQRPYEFRIPLKTQAFQVRAHKIQARPCIVGVLITGNVLPIYPQSVFRLGHFAKIMDSGRLIRGRQDQLVSAVPISLPN